MNVFTKLILTAGASLMFFNLNAQDNLLEKRKKEIYNTEISFAKRVKEKGINEAFLFYAADDAVLKQEDTLFIGKNAIENFYKSQPLPPSIDLTWTPDFVDVSKSGDLGYTYGFYTLSFEAAQGKLVEKKGVFHTIWKRQADGSWKFVWD